MHSASENKQNKQNPRRKLEEKPNNSPPPPPKKVCQSCVTAGSSRSKGLLEEESFCSLLDSGCDCQNITHHWNCWTKPKIFLVLFGKGMSLKAFLSGRTFWILKDAHLRLLELVPMVQPASNWGVLRGECQTFSKRRECQRWRQNWGGGHEHETKQRLSG